MEEATKSSVSACSQYNREGCRMNWCWMRSCDECSVTEHQWLSMSAYLQTFVILGTPTLCSADEFCRYCGLYVSNWRSPWRMDTVLGTCTIVKYCFVLSIASSSLAFSALSYMLRLRKTKQKERKEQKTRLKSTVLWLKSFGNQWLTGRCVARSTVIDGVCFRCHFYTRESRRGNSVAPAASRDSAVALPIIEKSVRRTQQSVALTSSALRQLGGTGKMGAYNSVLHASRAR